MANDVERFLNHEPVAAGPPPTAYRFRKFVRRNRVQVVAALALLALVVGIVGTTLGWLEAIRQGRIAIIATGEKEKSAAGGSPSETKGREAVRPNQVVDRLADLKTRTILVNLLGTHHPYTIEFLEVLTTAYEDIGEPDRALPNAARMY